jgi:radical SAM protein with 4Fe4S-binding SPASM domain
MWGSFKTAVKRNPKVYRWVQVGAAAAAGARGLWKGRRGSREHLLSTVSLAAKSDRILGRPMNLTIEPTNVCNLECPVCETGAGELGRLAGHMTVPEFKAIVDKMGAHVNTLMFYYMGEPFLNKNAYEMVRYAKDRGIPFIQTCTNGDLVKPDRLVECGLDEVSFQIGGMTQETHRIYRIKSNLDRVLANLKETLRLRNEKRAPLRVLAGFILMKHNEHEVERFRTTMAELGVDHAEVIDPCVRTMEQGRQMLPTDRAHWYYDPEAFEKGTLRPKVLPDNDCPWLYYSMTIHVNGDVVPCCRDPKGLEIVGNILRQDLQEVWNGEKFRRFRERLHRDQGSIEICRLCSAYGASAIH